MAGEFDFEPLSDEALGLVGEDDCPFFVNSEGQLEWMDGRLDALLGARPHPRVANMARELRASRAAMRALVEANDDHTPGGRQRWEAAAATIRALVAHVDGGGE